MKSILLAVLLVSAAAVAQEAVPAATSIKVTCTVPENEVTKAFSATLEYSGETGTLTFEGSPLNCKASIITQEKADADIAATKVEIAEIIAGVDDKDKEAISKKGEALIQTMQSELATITGLTGYRCLDTDQAFTFYLGKDGKASQLGYDAEGIGFIIAQIECR